MPIALLGLRLAQISDKVRKHLGEIMSPRWILKHRLNLFGIGSVKVKERIPVILFIIYLSMIEISRLIVTLLMHWQKTFFHNSSSAFSTDAFVPCLFARKLKSKTVGEIDTSYAYFIYLPDSTLGEAVSPPHPPPPPPPENLNFGVEGGVCVILQKVT